jgi:hypothetical protein
MRYLFAIVLVIGLTAPEAFAQGRSSGGFFSGWTANANASVGLKALDDDDWGPADTQTSLHLDFDARPQNWPVSLAAQMAFSMGDGTEDDGFGGQTKVEGQTQELNLGVRKIFEPTPNIRPYVGGGLSLIRADVTVDGTSDDDMGAGIWVGGGAYWHFANGFNVGVQADWTKADVTIGGVTGDAGGAQISVMGGYSF